MGSKSEPYVVHRENFEMFLLVALGVAEIEKHNIMAIKK